ncbi:MAG TPA: hypothetical protein VGR57_12755 [Ktedonobacterales bacterium]|nr:hypothetical protein [Ktedonobacterales bacterium]
MSQPRATRDQPPLAALARRSRRALGRVPAPAWVAALALVVAVAAFALGRASAPQPSFALAPAHVALPARATLVRREEYLAERVQNWYYVVPGATHAGLTAFYRARLTSDGWTCFRAMTSTNITRDGKAYSGSSVYMTALRGTMKAQIYTADQEYGAFLLQDDLPAGAIGLKISLEVTDKPVCV